ncbi:YihY/virulence factor BrkB family protein [Synechocystis sp. LKSZ1]|uniref:YihY/virulence factor BrkB family protein n=1 Tax=Synechocystis sp. LKSZ1 TaxID=3144951 RepID=UPI00336BD533
MFPKHLLAFLVQFWQTRLWPSRGVQLLWQTCRKWQRDDCLEMGAALAYYAFFSLFPLCLVILGVLGRVLGPTTDTYRQLLTLGQQVLPMETHTLAVEALNNLNRSSWGAGVVGFLLLLLAASKIFEALGRSVDKIWRETHPVQVSPSLTQNLVQSLRNKLWAFLLVFSTVFILLLSMLAQLSLQLITALLQSLDAGLRQQIPGWGPRTLEHWIVLENIQRIVAYSLLTAIILVAFKLLPNPRLLWRDILPGALLTSALLMALQSAVGSGMISLGKHFQAYGVIGNVMVLLLWIYLTFAIFFWGCEFTFVYTHLWGSRRLRGRPCHHPQFKP